MGIRFAALSGAVLAVMPAVSHGDILFDQPADLPHMIGNSSKGFLSEVGGQQLCDDFTLGADSTVTHVRWAGSYRTTFVPNLGNPWSVGSVVAFRLRFFTFSGPDPVNDPFASADVQAQVVGVLGQVNGFNIYEYEAALPAMPAFNGGERYAVSILENAPATIPGQSLWSLATATPTTVAWVWVDFWRPEVSTLSSAYAFQIRGNVIPAPASGLACIVAAALYGRHRRQRA